MSKERDLVSEHTPGPWRLGGSCRIVMAGMGNRVASLPLYNEQTPANARLIAAAPELLKCAEMLALVTAEGDFKSDEERMEMHRMAIAAVAKAKGQQP